MVSSKISFNTIHAASDRDEVAMMCKVLPLVLEDFDCPPALATSPLDGGVRSNALSVESIIELYPFGPLPATI
jgi:hypothetical protein